MKAPSYPSLSANGRHASSCLAANHIPIARALTPFSHLSSCPRARSRPRHLLAMATTATLGLLNLLPNPNPNPSSSSSKPFLKPPPRRHLGPLPSASGPQHLLPITPPLPATAAVAVAFSLPLFLNPQVSYVISSLSVHFDLGLSWSSGSVWFEGCARGGWGVRDLGRADLRVGPPGGDGQPLRVHALGGIFGMAVAAGPDHPERDQRAQEAGGARCPHARRRWGRRRTSAATADSVSDRSEDSAAHRGTSRSSP